MGRAISTEVRRPARGSAAEDGRRAPRRPTGARGNSGLSPPRRIMMSVTWDRPTSGVEPSSRTASPAWPASTAAGTRRSLCSFPPSRTMPTKRSTVHRTGGTPEESALVRAPPWLSDSSVETRWREHPTQRRSSRGYCETGSASRPLLHLHVRVHRRRLGRRATEVSRDHPRRRPSDPAPS
jgi:hypothetical protein